MNGTYAVIDILICIVIYCVLVLSLHIQSTARVHLCTPMHCVSYAYLCTVLFKFVKKLAHSVHGNFLMQTIVAKMIFNKFPNTLQAFETYLGWAEIISGMYNKPALSVHR